MLNSKDLKNHPRTQKTNIILCSPALDDRVGGFCPPLTPPYVPFMAYGGFLYMFKVAVYGDYPLVSEPLVSHARIL